MSFGGFLGMGDNYYPLPWSVLTYNPDLDGYEPAVIEVDDAIAIAEQVDV